MVMHFGITEKPTTDCVSLYNNAGLISKLSEEIAGENAENCIFSLPHSQLTLSLGVNPFEFLDELFIPKTRVLGLYVGEDFVILACVILTQYQRVADRRADRQTDVPIIANTGLCIASYADALQRKKSLATLPEPGRRSGHMPNPSTENQIKGKAED